MLGRQKYIKFSVILVAILVSSWLVYLKITMNAYEDEIGRRSIAINNLYGVRIHYQYNRESFFPHQPSARGSQAWLKHVRSTLPLVQKFLSQYPPHVIRKTLSDIFLLATLEFNGQRYGGTYGGSAIYISIGSFFRYSDSPLLGLMHAEFSSILFHRYEFPRQEWQATNKPGWKYVGTGFDMLARNDSYDQTPALLENGFLEGYSQASMEEDFNGLVQWAFAKPDRLSKLFVKYERIRKKYQLVIQFYKTVDPNIEIPGITADGETAEKFPY